MTPRSGKDGETVFVMPSSTGAYEATHGMMPRSLKNFGGSVNTFKSVLKPLGGIKDFTEPRAELDASRGTLTLGFSRSYDKKPEALHLTFAVGNDGNLAYHRSR